MTKIILATISPFRKQLFSTLGLEFNCERSDISEDFSDRPENPIDLVKVLSRLKAEAVAKKHDSGIVIGFDSVVYFNGKILEKPKTKDEAYLRLKDFSGKKHESHTGIHMIYLDSVNVLTEVCKTEIEFREITDPEIDFYLNQDEDFLKRALGYHPQRYLSSAFIKRITGSYNNVCCGLPVEKIVPMLFEMGYELKNGK